jgi:hypothetical protein
VGAFNTCVSWAQCRPAKDGTARVTKERVHNCRIQTICMICRIHYMAVFVLGCGVDSSEGGW